MYWLMNLNFWHGAWERKGNIDLESTQVRVKVFCLVCGEIGALISVIDEKVYELTSGKAWDTLRALRL